MIEGQFNSQGQLFFELDLIASDSLHLTVDAMLDTGFSGFLAINEQEIEALDWLFLEEETLRTA